MWQGNGDCIDFAPSDPRVPVTPGFQLRNWSRNNRDFMKTMRLQNIYEMKQFNDVSWYCLDIVVTTTTNYDLYDASISD